MSKIDLEYRFAAWIAAEGIPEAVRQHRFHPVRRWRFDFAWPEQKVAVEVDGGIYRGKGGHSTYAGIMSDCEKYEAALQLGWRVYRVPAPWIIQRGKEVKRPEVIEVLRGLLND